MQGKNSEIICVNSVRVHKRNYPMYSSNAHIRIQLGKNLINGFKTLYVFHLSMNNQCYWDFSTKKDLEFRFC